MNFFPQENINLEVLNLSWNGLYLQGATSISAALAKNQSLRELDISCNRLSEKCVASFLTGMRNNTTLKKLKVCVKYLGRSLQ
ncbi:hypothetical protein DPMN_112827 [Dreissena polymorpha]|uniref:Uncharacterized protein n=1 Tax=Dreissena polymorpha TaxID=45954 RepID=A0A9D4KHK0_DREPO|nr:hypothetical protein DPMN_112827 [Dreissena polymorpha]